jgi:hypothetical protein
MHISIGKHFAPIIFQAKRPGHDLIFCLENVYWWKSHVLDVKGCNSQSASGY